MSVTTPESNVQFTDEQTRQIETFKSQLVNLQADVSIHSQSLRTLQGEIVRATKEKISLEELNVGLSEGNDVFKRENEQLNSQLAVSRNDLEKSLSQNNLIKDEILLGQSALEKRQQEIDQLLASAKADRDNLNNEIVKFEEEKRSFDKKRKQLLELIEQYGN